MTERLREGLLRGLLGLAVAVVLSACVSGAITTANVGVLHYELEKERFKERLGDEAQEYLKDHANSPCTHDEDAIMPELVDFIREKGKKGPDIAIKRLESIADDSTYPDDVRASALYHMAVIQFRRPEPNHYLAIEYLKRINREYPGKYQCIFEDTPWRRHMEQKLGIPKDMIPTQDTLEAETNSAS